MGIDKIDMALKQKRAMEAAQSAQSGNYPDSAPYYIQVLERRLDMINSKLNQALKALGLDDAV